MVQPRIIRLFDALSQFFNVLIFNGDPNHSISGDAYRFDRVRLRLFLDFLFSLWETEHCKNSHINDVKKAMFLVKKYESYESYES